MVWEARRKACSRTSSSMPGWSGSTTSSPVASREKATRPGPWATLMMNGMPARARLTPPVSGRTLIFVASSFHSSTWCSKKIESPCPRLISATGTISPSTWQVLVPNWISVMSRMRGASRHPESLTRFLTSSGAPHDRHAVAVPGFWLLHHWHSMRTSGSLADGWGSVIAHPLPGFQVYDKRGAPHRLPGEPFTGDRSPLTLLALTRLARNGGAPAGVEVRVREGAGALRVLHLGAGKVAQGLFGQDDLLELLLH